MKKIALLLTSWVLMLIAAAQSKTVYNAYKPGLSIRDKPGTQGTVIAKIPYGEKLTLVNAYNDTVSVVNEGMSGYWNLVDYKGKKGYVVGIYLLEIAPPAAAVKTMEDYFKQLSPVAGPALSTVSGTKNDEMQSRFRKQLFKNGCELHEAYFYKSGYNTYFLPNLTLQQGFLLVRLIPEFKDVFGSADVFPSENKKIKMPAPAEGEKEINVIKAAGSNWIEKITAAYEDGAVYEFELFELHGQLVISFGGGV